MTAQQLESTDRFLRPPDVERTLRNYRRIQIQRLFALARSAAILLAELAGTLHPLFGFIGVVTHSTAYVIWAVFQQFIVQVFIVFAFQ